MQRQRQRAKTKAMDILLEQESNLNTIAALSTIAVMKTDNNHTAINRQVSSGVVEMSDMKNAANHAFNNLPPCEPIEIYFKDLSYSIQKMFSKS